MTGQILFPGENKKKYFKMSSAAEDFTQSVKRSSNVDTSIQTDLILNFYCLSYAIWTDK